MAQGRVMVLVFVSHCWYYIVVCVTSGGNQEKAITQIPSSKGVKNIWYPGQNPTFLFHYFIQQKSQSTYQCDWWGAFKEIKRSCRERPLEQPESTL